MSTCGFTTIINDTDCIGDSRITINSNFTNLDTNLCVQTASSISLQSQINLYSTILHNLTSVIPVNITMRGTNVIYTPLVSKQYTISVSGTVEMPDNNGGKVSFTINGNNTDVLSQWLFHTDGGKDSSGGNGGTWPFNLVWSGTLLAGTSYNLNLVTFGSDGVTVSGGIMSTTSGWPRPSWASDSLSNYNPYWVIQ